MLHPPPRLRPLPHRPGVRRPRGCAAALADFPTNHARAPLVALAAALPPAPARPLVVGFPTNPACAFLVQFAAALHPLEFLIFQNRLGSAFYIFLVVLQIERIGYAIFAVLGVIYISIPLLVFHELTRWGWEYRPAPNSSRFAREALNPEHSGRRLHLPGLPDGREDRLRDHRGAGPPAAQRPQVAVRQNGVIRDAAPPELTPTQC